VGVKDFVTTTPKHKSALLMGEIKLTYVRICVTLFMDDPLSQCFQTIFALWNLYMVKEQLGGALIENFKKLKVTNH
jgi:hypothetical protein